MEHVYCISGFGADERVFSKLDFGQNEVHFIQWKIPFKNETLDEYVKRMAGEIHHENPVLMGLSFGGIMSVEIAKTLSFKKIILLSSVATVDEMPWYMKIAGRLKLDKIFPLRPSKLLAPLEDYNLGVKTPEEKKLVAEYRRNIDPYYTSWGIDKIVNWKNKWRPPHLTHIHGDNDHIFPAKYVKTDYIIKGGGHLFLMDRASEVNEILKKLL